MSKELEALYKISQIEFETGDYMNDDGYMMTIVGTEMYAILLKALTPPTVEEVCKELTEHLYKNVFFNKKECSFCYTDYSRYYVHNETICICWYNWEYGYLSFEKELPPRLAKMICSFYESLVEKERIKNE